MAARSAGAQYIDTRELTRLGQQVQGQTPLRQFKRLVAGLPDQSDAVASWSVTGLLDRVGQSFLDVSVQAAPQVVCQRCMATMSYPVDATSRLKLVQTEAELDEDDPDTPPEDWIEPVLASSHFDVLALIEDELILELPHVPMHEQCSMDATGGAGHADEDGDPSPFDILRQLKKD